MERFEVFKRRDLTEASGIYILLFSDNTFYIAATENIEDQVTLDYRNILTSETGWRHSIKKLICNHYLYRIRGYKYCWACCTRILIAPYNSYSAAQEDLDSWLGQITLEKLDKRDNYYKVDLVLTPFLNCKELFSK